MLAARTKIVVKATVWNASCISCEGDSDQSFAVDSTSERVRITYPCKSVVMPERRTY